MAAGSPRTTSRSTSLTDRIALVIVVLASAWFAFTAFWGFAGIPGGGHLGAGSAGNTMAAEQIVKWHIFYPAWEWYTGVPPQKVSYICHHPFGQYWVPAVFLWIFGHHDFVVHLPAALMSAAVPPMLYGIAREKWGPVPGAVAAAAYVVVPVTVGFSNFMNLETFCIFGALLFFWGHTRHMVTGKRRYMVASLVGLFFACSGDWAGYLLVAPAIIWFFLRGFLLPRWLVPRFKFEPYARWWGLSVGVVAATLLLWLVLFVKADQIADWVMAAFGRAGGEGTKLKDVLEARKNWIDFSFTPLAIRLGKWAWPVCVLRLLWTRRDEEVYSLSLLFGATVQYVVFKLGADIHIFWSIYFAPFYALALAQLVHTVGAVVGFVVSRFKPAWRTATVAWVALVIGIAPSVAMAHDGVKSLWVWRATGGRYDDNGTLIRSHIDLLTVVKQVILPRTVRGMSIDTNGSAQWGWEHQWTWQGLNNNAGLPLSSAKQAATHPFWIGRGSGLLGDEQRKVVAAAHVRIYGDTWVVDQREPLGPIDAYSMNEREPGFFEWLFLDGGTEPHREAGKDPDPWLTWEWRVHLGQDAVPPTGEPKTLDEMRIAHNMAIERGDTAAAEHWRERIDAGIDRTVNAKFDEWANLIGIRLIGGVQPRIETWFEATEAPTGEAQFSVRSVVIGKERWSLIPRPTQERDMAWAPSIPTKLWRKGFIYRTETVMNHRIGVEQYLGRWSTRDGVPAPKRLDHHPETTLAIVE
ncbi:MAG TPA: glycosyltransferase family 39 protein [Polyangiaceae bacterium]